MFSLEILPVVGLPQTRGWSQVITNIHDELIVTFAISGPNANDHGRDIAEIWRKSTPKSAANLHQLLLDVIRRVHQVGCETYFAVGLFVDNSFQTEIPTVFATYNGSILLKKNHKIGQLLNSHGELKVVEGTAQNEMVIVLSTQAAHSFAGEISQKLQQGFEVGTIVTSLIPGIHGLPDSSLHACSFIVCQVPEPQSTVKASSAEPLEKKDNQIETNQKSLASSRLESHKSISVSTETPILEISAAVQSAVNSSGIGNFNSTGSNLSKVSLVKRIFHSLKKSWRIIHKAVVQAPAKFSVWGPRFGAAGIIICLGWAGWQWQRRQLSQEVTVINQKLQPLIERVDQAQSTKDSSPLQSRQAIEQVSLELNDLAKTYTKASTPVKKRILQVQTQTQAVADSISGMKEIDELPTFFDLRLIDTDFVATTADSAGENIFFLDTGKNQVIRLNLIKKESEVLPIGTQTNLKDLAVTDRYLYLLGNGVLRYQMGSDQPAESVPAKDDDPAKTGAFLKQFGSFLYVFNVDKRNIYRYNQTENSDSPIGWLISKKDLDFSQVRSLAIDGDVWLGTKVGEVKKFTQGKQQSFEIKGLKDLPNSPIIVYTTDKISQLYVLEPDQTRLIILKKDGEFIRQIKSKTFGSVTSLVVNEDNQKAYALSGSVVYEVDIN